jgi:hypothetical protein
MLQKIPDEIASLSQIQAQNELFQSLCLVNIRPKDGSAQCRLSEISSWNNSVCWTWPMPHPN